MGQVCKYYSISDDPALQHHKPSYLSINNDRAQSVWTFFPDAKSPYEAKVQQSSAPSGPAGDASDDLHQSETASTTSPSPFEARFADPHYNPQTRMHGNTPPAVNRTIGRFLTTERVMWTSREPECYDDYSSRMRRDPPATNDRIGEPTKLIFLFHKKIQHEMLRVATSPTLT